MTITPSVFHVNLKQKIWKEKIKQIGSDSDDVKRDVMHLFGFMSRYQLTELLLTLNCKEGKCIQVNDREAFTTVVRGGAGAYTRGVNRAKYLLHRALRNADIDIGVFVKLPHCKSSDSSPCLNPFHHSLLQGLCCCCCC